jgi:hypothetical protein
MRISPPPATLPKDFYVYEHRKATTGEVFYIGKGKDGRAWFTGNRKRHWINIAKKHGVVVNIIQDGLQEWFAHELERDLIALHGRMDCGLGPLVNVTDGGEGTSGWKMPDMQRKNLSESKKTPDAIARNISVHLGRKRNETTRSLISKALKGRVMTEDERAMRSSVMSSQGVKEKLRAAQLGRVTPRQLEAHKARPILCVETGVIFASTGEARRWLQSNGHPKASNAHVWSCCNGTRNIAYGYTWRYAE